MGIFSKLTKTAQVMCICLGLMFVVFLTVGLSIIWFVFPFEKASAFVIGLLTGILLSIVKVILLEKSLANAVEMEDDGKVKNYANLQSILRYLGTMVVLLGAVFFPQVFGVFGIIIGVLSLQISAYITGGILKAKPELVEGPEHPELLKTPEEWDREVELEQLEEDQLADDQIDVGDSAGIISAGVDKSRKKKKTWLEELI